MKYGKIVNGDNVLFGLVGPADAAGGYLKIMIDGTPKDFLWFSTNSWTFIPDAVDEDALLGTVVKDTEGSLYIKVGYDTWIPETGSTGTWTVTFFRTRDVAKLGVEIVEPAE